MNRSLEMIEESTAIVDEDSDGDLVSDGTIETIDEISIADSIDSDNDSIQHEANMVYDCDDMQL